MRALDPRGGIEVRRGAAGEACMSSDRSCSGAMCRSRRALFQDRRMAICDPFRVAHASSRTAPFGLISVTPSGSGTPRTCDAVLVESHSAITVWCHVGSSSTPKHISVTPLGSVTPRTCAAVLVESPTAIGVWYHVGSSLTPKGSQKLDRVPIRGTTPQGSQSHPFCRAARTMNAEPWR